MVDAAVFWKELDMQAVRDQVMLAIDVFLESRDKVVPGDVLGFLQAYGSEVAGGIGEQLDGQELEEQGSANLPRGLEVEYVPQGRHDRCLVGPHLGSRPPVGTGRGERTRPPTFWIGSGART